MSENIYKIIGFSLLFVLINIDLYASENLRVLLPLDNKQLEIILMRGKIYEISDNRSDCPQDIFNDNDEISSLINNNTGKTNQTEMNLIEQIGEERKIKIILDDRIRISGHNNRYKSILIKNESGSMSFNKNFIRGDLEIRIVSGTLKLINIINLEEYLRYTISKEMNSLWPIEALKAQAVLARTYALKKKYKSKTCLYDIGVTTLDQVYGTYNEDSIEVLTAVSSTEGEVLKYNGEIIEAFYHSCCGGHTSDSKDIFGTDLPYLKANECVCNGNCSYGRGWSIKVKLEDISKLLGIKNIEAVKVKNNKVVINGEKNLSLTKNAFREKIGFTKLKSSNYSIRMEGKDIIVQGKGFGHTVGLCQYGAKKMAEEGVNYRDILLHYFRGVSIEKIY